MEWNTLTLESVGPVALIRLNRPEHGNALSVEMARELAGAALHCETESNIKAVILTGNGSMFCGGGDLFSFAADPDNVGEMLSEATAYFHLAISRFNHMDPVVIAAVNGAAAGGGLSLMLSADLAYAAQSSKFTMAYTRAGLVPDGGATLALAASVGFRRAKELVLTNRVLSAEEALQWGLVNRVVPDDKLIDEALEAATGFASGPLLAYGVSKRLLMDGLSSSLETQLERESRAIATAAESDDGIEGVAAFTRKRKPVFRGS